MVNSSTAVLLRSRGRIGLMETVEKWNAFARSYHENNKQPMSCDAQLQGTQIGRRKISGKNVRIHLQDYTSLYVQRL